MDCFCYISTVLLLLNKCSYCRVARHRREVVEPEVLAEGTDSEEEKGRRRDEEESSEEEEELDDEVGIVYL